MKKILISLALVIGLLGVSHAAGRAGGGWRSFTVTASSAQIATGAGFLNSMYLGPACSTGDYVVAVDTPGVAQGSPGSGTNVTYTAYASSQVITPPTIFPSTGLIFSTSVTPGSANYLWAPGASPDDYVEFLNGLFVFKSNTGGLGGACDQVTVYYSK